MQHKPLNYRPYAKSTLLCDSLVNYSQGRLLSAGALNCYYLLILKQWLKLVSVTMRMCHCQMALLVLGVSLLHYLIIQK